MPHGFSENLQQQIREKLIRSAYAALDNAGVRKTTVEELAKSAGISTGAFYKFFPAKESLFFVIYDRSEEKLKSEFRSMLETSARISPLTLRDTLKRLIHSETMQTLLCLMQKEEMDYLLRGIDPGTIEQHLQKDVVFLQEVIQKLNTEGIQVKNDVDTILSYLQALFVLCAARDQYRQHADQIMDAFIDTFVNETVA